MSWFGETFGDSLNSLKGQITKITKEVLADDEAANSESQVPENQLVKELQALCESKDVEIAALRDEFSKLHMQYKTQVEFLKSGNASEGISDSDGSLLKKLENELDQLRQERDHLNLCLEELQSEHQINLDQVISLKDKYKSELETLKKEYNLVKAKSEESNIHKEEVYQDSEISQLKTKINDLELLLEKEREDSANALKNATKTQNELKEKLDKLSSEIQLLTNDKEKINIDKSNIQKENEKLKTKLIEKEKENEEAKLNMKLLINEKAELTEKCQNLEVIELKLSGLINFESEVQQKLQNFSQLLNIEVNGNSVLGLLNLIENKLQKLKDSTSHLELEVKNLKEDNKSFQNKLKLSIENAAEVEKKYQEEISVLKNSLSEMKTQEQDCLSQSQTDDVKRLEQEVAQCMSLILTKNNEINDYSKLLNNKEQEIKNLIASSATIKEELLTVKNEKNMLEEEVLSLKNFNSNFSKEKAELENRIRNLELEKINLSDSKNECQNKVDTLEKEAEVLKSEVERVKSAQEELGKTTVLKSELEKKLTELQNENLNLKNEFKHLKAEVIIKESSLAELMKANTFFQEEMNKLQSQNNELVGSEKEVKKWKDASVDLQIQLEDVTAKREQLENECLRLKSELEISLAAKDAEIQQLRVNNSNIMKSYNELHDQLQTKTQEEHFSYTQKSETDEKFRKQEEFISQLEEENAELKSRVQKFQEQLKMQMFHTQNEMILKDDAQQHRRSKSAVDAESIDPHKLAGHENDELLLLKQALQQEQTKYQLLQHQFQEISNKEANARKEFERLKKHLIEIEDHYTEEAVENEKIINDLKSKLIAAEEQLQNSSTLYTSLKVRDNQHLESLQSQIRMVSAQRDDLQTKVSAAEDEIQKHKASLMSLQIVLEQFQQDKDREVEEVAMKYEKQLQSAGDHFRALESEIQSLKNQLAEAKNGLKAASRLGEQLEKKTQQVSDLEEKLSTVSNRVAELENSLSSANQVNNGKIDKSLIKNLVVGYVLSPNAERKSQVLRIMASVLDFDQDERNKMGVDNTRSGWLSNILHPKGDAPPNSQSLSEAFIKFLENESRPQPQLKLLPEQLEATTSKTSRPSPKPSGRLTELTLPTFNSSQDNESSVILKNVLKDS